MPTVSDKDLFWLNQVAGDWPNDEPRKVGLVDLAQHLSVTTRTVQSWIKRLDQDGWIDWSSKQGRGYVPEMTRRRDPGRALADRCLSYLKQGRSEKALQFLPDAYKADVLRWFIQSSNKQSAHAESKLYIPFYRPIHDLHPHTATRRTEAHLIDHLHRGLVFFDAFDVQLKPGIAHHWDIDGCHCRFYLRKNVYFHDGSRVTAQSVVEAFTWLSRQKHPNAVFTESIRSLEAPSEFTLDITLKEKHPLFIQILSLNCFAVIKPHYEREDPIGCGPFWLKEKGEQRTVLCAFDDFYAERPLIDAVEFWTLAPDDPSIELNAHVMSRYRMAGKEWPSQVRRHVEVGASMLMFNQQKNTQLRKREVRGSLTDALNFRHILSESNDSFIRAYGLIPDRKPHSIRSEKSKDPEPLPTHLHVVTYQLKSHITIANWLADCWSALGISCDVTVLDYPRFSKPNALAEYDVFVTGEVFDGNIELSYYQFFKSNYLFDTGLPKRVLNTLHQKVDTLDPNKGIQKQLQCIEDTLLEDIHLYPISHFERDVHVSNVVSNLRINAYGWMDFCHVWLPPG